MSEKLDFFASYGPIDIWQSQDTMAGITKYVFYYKDTPHECETYPEAINVAKFLLKKDGLER